MPFDWYAFLQLAHFLHRQPSGISMEADQRTVVSRSYYAAFGFVRDYARDHLGFQPRDEATGPWLVTCTATTRQDPGDSGKAGRLTSLAKCLRLQRGLAL